MDSKRSSRTTSFCFPPANSGTFPTTARQRRMDASVSAILLRLPVANTWSTDAKSSASPAASCRVPRDASMRCFTRSISPSTLTELAEAFSDSDSRPRISSSPPRKAPACSFTRTISRVALPGRAWRCDPSTRATQTRGVCAHRGARCRVLTLSSSREATTSSAISCSFISSSFKYFSSGSSAGAAAQALLTNSTGSNPSAAKAASELSRALMATAAAPLAGRDSDVTCAGPAPGQGLAPRRATVLPICAPRGCYRAR
eukprot:scaffold1945_cov395-Prasinococcus_capsulatus_cf.AAC.8